MALMSHSTFEGVGQSSAANHARAEVIIQKASTRPSKFTKATALFIASNEIIEISRAQLLTPPSLCFTDDLQLSYNSFKA